MGEFLRERAHRRIAYITQKSGAGVPDGIDENRLAGLRSVFDAHPGASAVRVLMLPAPDTSGKHEVFADLLQSLRDRTGIAVPKTAVAGDSTGERCLDRLRFAVNEFVEAAQVQSGAAGMLEDLLADSTISAWVCFSDALAVQVARYLRVSGRRGATRPLLLAGFDDSREAFYERICSYNFNGAAYMHAMVDYILNPCRPETGLRFEDAIEFDGFVSER